jgi:hypothetical protein
MSQDPSRKKRQPTDHPICSSMARGSSDKNCGNWDKKQSLCYILSSIYLNPGERGEPGPHKIAKHEIDQPELLTVARFAPSTD